MKPRSKVSSLSLSPGRIALGYTVIATLWIMFSDEIVTHLHLPPAVNTIKGEVFVFVTAALLYFTIRRLVQFVQQTSQERDETAEALQRSNRELHAISNCNQVLLRATNEESLLQEICRIVCEEAGYRVAWVGYAEHDEAKSVRQVASTGVEEESLAKLAITWADTERGRGPCGAAIRTGKTSCIEDCFTDARVSPWKDFALQHGFGSVVALPLKDEQANTFGCLIIYAAQPNAFTSDEIRLLEELADDLAFGIVTLRSRIARERAEQEVALLSFALDKGHEAAFLMEEERLCYVNEEACRRLGYTREELLGMAVKDIDPDFPVEHWSDHWQELKAQQSLTFESHHRTRDGRIFPVEITANYFEFGGRAYNLALVRDITERKRVEDALRRNETYLAEGQRLAHMGSWAWNPVTYQVLYWSEEMFHIYGLNPQEGVPTTETFWQRIHPEDLDRMRELLQRAVTEDRDYEHDLRIVLPDGTIKHIHAVGHPVHDAAGNLIEYFGTALDVTERKRSEDALRRSEAYLAEGQRLARMGSWVWDAATHKALYWSEEMFRIFGIDPEDGLPTGEAFWQRIHPEDRDSVSELFMKVAQHGTDYEHDHRIVLPDGTIKHIHAVGHPVLDEHGQVVEYVGTAMDVTEHKLAEDELRKHREHLEDLVKQRTEELAVLNQLVYGSLEAADVGAWWIDFKEPDTCHALDNTARMLGWEPDPSGTKTYKFSDWNRLLTDTAATFPEHAANIEETHQRFAGAVSGKYENYRAVYPLAMPDGSLKWIDGRAEIAKRDEHGQALLMTGTFIDVTRSKRAEADIEEAKARAEAANRAKSVFLANMSHELRTPLNAVLGFSRLLKNDPGLTPEQQETLDVIVRSGEHLLNLINNVLDMAKIESGRVSLKDSDVDLRRLLHEMQSLMGAGAVEKGLRFALEDDPDLPRFVAVDAGRLRQVLLNLLGNAIKYTDSGGVKLRARLTNLHGSEKAKVRFEVEDSGPGISPEDCQRIFVPFVQLDDQAPVQAGTGLGLAICKQYVELMGGQIGVTSQPGKGSVFYFEIPVTILPSMPERDELKPPRILGLAEGQPRHRLLIVEDQPENRLLLRRLLDPFGFELREATNGQEAVALFEQWQPDLIWMDIRMPVMDGLEAVRRIRATQAGAATKIIALTAQALEEERQPIMAAGCDDLVRKPFHEQELFGTLARHLHLKFIYEKTLPPENTPEPPEPALRPEQLDALPAELVQDLRQAVIELDTERTHALIAEVAERDASLGRALNTLAAGLNYNRLLKLLEKEPSQAE